MRPLLPSYSVPEQDADLLGAGVVLTWERLHERHKEPIPRCPLCRERWLEVAQRKPYDPLPTELADLQKAFDARVQEILPYFQPRWAQIDSVDWLPETNEIQARTVRTAPLLNAVDTEAVVRAIRTVFVQRERPVPIPPVDVPTLSLSQMIAWAVRRNLAPRTIDILRARQAGQTFKEIGRQHSISAQRVSAIIDEVSRTINRSRKMRVFNRGR